MRKILALFLAVILTVATMSISVSAADLKDITFSLSSNITTVEPGNQLKIMVDVSEDEYVMGGTFNLKYDSSSFEYVKCLSYGTPTVNTSVADNLKIVFASSAGIPNSLITITFNVKETAKAGTANFEWTASDFYIYPGYVVAGGVTYDKTPTIENTSVTIKAFSVSSVQSSTAEKITFSNTITDAPSAGVLWAALYNQNDVLVSCGWADFVAGSSTPTIEIDKVDYDATKTKIFVWKADGTPLLDTPVVPVAQ